MSKLSIIKNDKLQIIIFTANLFPRSARIRAGLAGSQPLEADRFLNSQLFPDSHPVFRFYGLTERMGRMEATIGPILNKLDSVLIRYCDGGSLNAG